MDVARAIAILGMVTVHFGPYPVREDGPAAFLYGSWYGRASVLFVVVAGIGVGLLARRDPPRLVRARLWWRAVWLLPVGLWLQTLDHPVAVILQYYAVYFALVVPFVTRSDRSLLRWGAGLLAAGSAAVLAATVLAPEWVVPLGGDSPTGVVGDLLLFGYYPVLTWLPPMLWGLWLGRRRLDRRAVHVRLVVGGGLVLAGTVAVSRALETVAGLDVEPGSWWFALSAEGHSEMPLAVLGATGFASAVLGLSLWASGRWPAALSPLTALGRAALSVYVGHLVVFDLVPELFPADDVWEGIRTVGGFALVTAVLSLVWLAVAPRGPLEAAARAPFQYLIRPLVRRGSSPPPDAEAGTADPAPPTEPARTR